MRALYGANGELAVFPANNCTVVEPHEVVHCYTMPGAGVNIGWTLTIGGQTSQSPVTSYAVPTITAVTFLASNPAAGAYLGVVDPPWSCVPQSVSRVLSPPRLCVGVPL